MNINPHLIFLLVMGVLFLGAVGAFLTCIVKDHINAREEEKRYKKAKEDYRKALIEMCDVTIGFNRAVMKSIDEHAEHINKGIALVDKIKKTRHCTREQD